MNETTHKLKYPITTTDGRTLTELTLRRPKGKDLRALDKVQGDVTRTLSLIASLAKEQISPEDADQLDLADITSLGLLLGERESPA